MKTNLLKFSTVFILTLAIVGCDLQNNSLSYAAASASMIMLPTGPQTVWDRMAADFSFKTHQSNPRVVQFIKQYTKENSQNLIGFSGQATPYLYHVVELLEERGMPAELALLPMIESEYKPTALSNRGASGIWQLVPTTGRLYGLKRDQWYDGRKDTEAATKAALGHLQYLYEKFDHDWLLALAAYNCGDGRVASAIRQNKKIGKPTDYWSLKLPKETQYYVPKFLALVYLVQNHKILDIDLAAIPNSPHYSTVQFNKAISLQQAAKLADLDVKEIKKLNPAFTSHTTHPNGPHQLLLPVKNTAIFNKNYKASVAAATKPAKATTKPATTVKTTVQKKPQLATTKASPVKNASYTVTRGDTLNLIATKHRTTVANLKHKNKLKSDIIISGQKLAI